MSPDQTDGRRHLGFSDQVVAKIVEEAELKAARAKSPLWNPNWRMA